MRASRPPVHQLRAARRDDSWRAAGACPGLDVRVFYPDSGRRAGTANAVCATCPVQAACLEHALATVEGWGVWGGATEDERRAMRRQRRAAS